MIDLIRLGGKKPKTFSRSKSLACSRPYGSAERMEASVLRDNSQENVE